ncbi:MAG: polysaccharide pyruvyl transferase family protein [Thermoplasmata archaeon]|nr:MAG: polysaccharide pyruvyl transferase family protein [Thermoplasmata archaeon]
MTGVDRVSETSGARIGGGPPEGATPRVLLVGYNGANNTGSESRLLSIIEDVRAVLGPEAIITIPTLNPVNLCRYIEETPTLRIAPVPSIYFSSLKRLVRQNDLVLLVEGSCYMDTWTSALLWAFLWATKQAARNDRPSMAYAVDSGHLSPSNLRRLRRDANLTDLIVLRTQAAADRMRSYGITAPIQVTADTTFTFRMDPGDEGILEREWSDAASGDVVGMAPIDFYMWPVVIRPFGRRADTYRWPYFYSRSRLRSEATTRLAKGLAREADRMVERYGKRIALFCMEELDEPIARQVQSLMSHGDRTRTFSSCDYNASQMQGLLKGMDMLVTSRYHAPVMASPAGVPAVAIGHDLRVEDLFKDMNIYKTNFIPHESNDLFERLTEMVDTVLTDPEPHKAEVLRAHAEHRDRALRNRQLLSSFLEEGGWSVNK